MRTLPLPAWSVEHVSGFVAAGDSAQRVAGHRLQVSGHDGRACSDVATCPGPAMMPTIASIQSRALPDADQGQGRLADPPTFGPADGVLRVVVSFDIRRVLHTIA